MKKVTIQAKYMDINGLILNIRVNKKTLLFIIKMIGHKLSEKGQ